MTNRTITLTTTEWAEVCNALRSAAIRYNEAGEGMYKLAKDGKHRDAAPDPVMEEIAKQFWSQAEYAHKYANHIEDVPDDGAELDLVTLIERNGL